MHLRGDRSEGIDGGRGGRDPPRERCPRVHDRRERRRLRPRAVPVRRAVLGRGARRPLDVQRRRRADRLRRPVEAGRRLPRDLVAAAPPAGPRGVPGRRLLPALPVAGALCQALGRERWGVDDGAADHRDEGRRHLRLHPDERDLHHRRAAVPRVGAVLLRGPPRDQRGRLGLPRGRRRADQGDEEGRRPAPPRPRAVPGARGVRAIRIRARQGVPAAARPRRPRRRGVEAAAVRPAAGRAAGRRDLQRDRGLHGRLPGRGCEALRRGVRDVPRDPQPRGLHGDPRHGGPFRADGGDVEGRHRGVPGRLRADADGPAVRKRRWARPPLPTR